MRSHSSIDKPSPQRDAPISTAAPRANETGSVWQRMLDAWLGTYELSYRSGAVPFLLL